MNAGWKITAPASSANLGPGFDSIGIAVSKYLTIEASICEEWSFHHHSDELKGLPEGKDHLLYQIAKKTADTYGASLPSCKVHVESDIPLARGLGSSAAVVAAGIELANVTCQLSLSMKDKLLLGTKFEGHADNVGASLLGGMIIGSYDRNDLHIVEASLTDVEIVVTIPNYELKTDDARQVLPDKISYQQAIKGSSVSNVFIAALLTENYALVGQMMERDVFHEPYRIPLISKFNEIRETAKLNGAYGTAISGAGPTAISLVCAENGEKVVHALQKRFPTMRVELLTIDQAGTIVEPIANK